MKTSDSGVVYGQEPPPTKCGMPSGLHTKEEVERNDTEVRSNIPETAVQTIAALDALKAAALVGTWVPFLCESLQDAFRCCGGSDETPRIHTRDCERHRLRAEEVEREVLGLKVTIARLTVERDGLAERLRRADEYRAGLQAQNEALQRGESPTASVYDPEEPMSF